MTAPDRIALRWELGAAVTSGPLMDHPDYTQYVRADMATPQSWDDVMGTKHLQFPRPTPLAEALVLKEAATAREVFEDYGSKAKEAIDYMEQLLLAALRAIGEGRNG